MSRYKNDDFWNKLETVVLNFGVEKWIDLQHRLHSINVDTNIKDHNTICIYWTFVGDFGPVFSPFINLNKKNLTAYELYVLNNICSNLNTHCYQNAYDTPDKLCDKLRSLGCEFLKEQEIAKYSNNLFQEKLYVLDEYEAFIVKIEHGDLSRIYNFIKNLMLLSKYHMYDVNVLSAVYMDDSKRTWALTCDVGHKEGNNNIDIDEMELIFRNISGTRVSVTRFGEV